MDVRSNMKKSFVQKNEIKQGKLVPRHGWNYQHFFVKGHSLCQGWTSSIKGHNNFYNRLPRWRFEEGEFRWQDKKHDCVKCIRIWLELYCMFREFDKRKERLFP